MVGIDRVGWERLATATALPEVRWSVEADGELLACGSSGLAAALADRGFEVLAVHPFVDRARLRLGRGLEPDTIRDLGAEVLVGCAAGAVLRFGDGWPPPAPAAPEGRTDYRALVPIEGSLVLARQATNQRPRALPPVDAVQRSLADEVNPQRWFADLSTLAGYNRYTLGSGILSARDWIVQQLAALPGVTVTTPSFMVWSTTAYNVIGTLPGTMRPDDWYLVGGHYDSTSQSPYSAAPGAEDNASGCAGVIELARVFAAHPPEATMLFICYAGEEQGLLGSEDHAGDLVASGDADKVQGVLDMDMIGFTEDADLDCLLESEPFAQSLVDAFADAAAQLTTLRIVTSMSAWGSDHVPYLDRGMPALLTIENDWDSYPDYHTTGDLPANITVDMGHQVLRMNAGALAGLTGAGSSLLFRDGFESGSTGGWSAATP